MQVVLKLSVQVCRQAQCTGLHQLIYSLTKHTAIPLVKSEPAMHSISDYRLMYLGLMVAVPRQCELYVLSNGPGA